jgi:hypothetical protein
VDQGGGISGYPREDENMRYWVKANLAQGQSTSLYEGSGDDESDSWSSPPKMSAEMNREGSGDIYDRIHISFHSNAGGGRGTVGLITGDPTPNQADLANIAGGEVNDDLVALGSPLLEFPWFNKSTHTYSGGYSEIDGSLFIYEMAATIIEVAFHDDPTDAALLRDPKARSAIGLARPAMGAVIQPPAPPKYPSGTEGAKVQGMERTIEIIANDVTSRNQAFTDVVLEMRRRTEGLKVTDLPPPPSKSAKGASKIQNPLTFDPARLAVPDALEIGTWWSQMLPEERREFAKYYGLWCAFMRGRK